MLDQADFIARYDKSDLLGVAGVQPEQLMHQFEAPVGLERVEVSQIVLAGLGDSALGGEFMRSWLGDRLPVPIEVVRDYSLPGYVGKGTLVVCASYSGNSEETLAAYEAATKLGATIVAITAGGRLLELAKGAAVAHIQLPGGLEPRFGFMYALRAWAQLLEALKLSDGLVRELEAASGWLAKEAEVWQAERATDTNPAKQVAVELIGHPVVVYGGPALRLAAYKWKLDINQNAKQLAWWNELPEMNHNEFIGWQKPERPGVKVVELRSELDHAQVGKRFEAMNSLLSNRFAPIEVRAQGKTRLEQLLWTMLLGDFVSIYLGTLNSVDPADMQLVAKLKERLG